MRISDWSSDVCSSDLLDDREIELELSANVGVDIMTPPGMEEMGQQLRQMFSSLGGGKTHKRSLSIKAARPLLVEEEAGKLVNEDEVREAAIEACRSEEIGRASCRERVCQYV